MCVFGWLVTCFDADADVISLSIDTFVELGFHIDILMPLMMAISRFL